MGVHVRLQVDGRSYIQTVEIVDDGKSVSVTDINFDGRLAVLKAVAAFAATRTDIKSADVLTIAERWLQWVERN